MILGINGHPEFSHDAGVAVVRDGRVVAVFEEERFSRRKKAHKTLPTHALDEVARRFAGENVDAVGYAWNPSRWGYDVDEFRALLMTALRRSGLLESGRQPDIQFVDHHSAHAHSAHAFLDPLRRDLPTLHVVLDGRGEVSAGAIYLVEDGDWEHVADLPLMSSLGLHYEAMTQALGFSWGQEGKTMGLAAYAVADDSLVAAVSGPVAHLLDWTLDGPVAPRDRLSIKTSYNAERAFRTTEFREGITAPRDTFIARAAWAASTQAWLESAVRGLVSRAIDARPHARQVVLSGGVALNCSVNSSLEPLLAAGGRLFSVPPCASDTGVALGAALATAATTGQYVQSGLDAFQGVVADVSDLASLGCEVHPATAEVIADVLVSGEVLGRVEGSAELGPRALGNRAILALPRTTALRDRINVLKGRETWRPLAPIFTADAALEVLRGSYDSFMLRTSYLIDDERLQAVRHVDGTARAKVTGADETGLNALLGAVGERTGLAAVLCTSFNAAGEPIVNQMADAVATGRLLGLDGLCGDGWLARFV